MFSWLVALIADAIVASGEKAEKKASEEYYETRYGNEKK